jgi:hypothetical protein
VTKPTRLLLSAAFAGFTAVAVDLHGVWAGHLLDLRAKSEYCQGKQLGVQLDSTSWLPLSHRCMWEDGTATELVPAHVNPGDCPGFD